MSMERVGVRAVIEGQAAFLNGIKQMNKEVGDMSRDIAKVGPVSQTAAAQAQKSMGGLGKTFGDIAKIAGGFIIGAGLLKLPGLITGTVGAASNLNESLSKSAVVFGDANAKVLEFASSAAKGLGQSRQQAIEATATFGNFLTAMGSAPPAAADMSIAMVKLATDLASFNNQDPTEVLLALRSGLSGEAEPLRRFGVAISEAAVQAKALELGLAPATQNINDIKAAQVAARSAQEAYSKAVKEHGANSLEAQKAQVALASAEERLGGAVKGSATALTDQQKIMARYAIIMDQTKTAQGDFDRTSDGLANRQRILAAQFKDLQATIGQALLPIFVSLAGIVIEKVVPAFQKLADFIGPKITEGIQTARDAIAPFIEKLKPLFESLSQNKEVVAAFAAILSGVLAGAVLALTIAIGGLVVGIIGVVAPFIAIGAVLATAGIALSKLGVDFGALKEVIGIGVANIKGYFESDLRPAFENIKTAVMAVVNVFVENWPRIEKVVRPIMEIIATLIKQHVDTIMTVLGVLIDLIQGDFSGAWDRLTGLVERTWERIKDVVSSGIEAIKALAPLMLDVAEAIGKQLLVGIGDLADELEKLGKLAVQGLIKGVKSGLGEVDNIAADLANRLTGGLAGKLGVDSPSRVAMEIGEDFIKGLDIGLQAEMRTVIANMDKSAEELYGSFESIEDQTKKLFRLFREKGVEPKFLDSVLDYLSAFELAVDKIEASVSTKMARLKDPVLTNAPKSTTPWNTGGGHSAPPFPGGATGGSHSAPGFPGAGKGFPGAPTYPGPYKPPTGGSSFGAIGVYKSFQHGTPFVPRDMLAFLHQGEAIIPARQVMASISPSVMAAAQNRPTQGSTTTVQLNVSGATVEQQEEVAVRAIRGYFSNMRYRALNAGALISSAVG